MPLPKNATLATRLFTVFPMIFGAIRKSAHHDHCTIAPNQLYILRHLYHHPRTINALAIETHVSPPTISNAVTALARKKLVQRVRDPHDRRKVSITLTAHGTRMMQRAHRNITKELAQQLKTLSKKERAIVSDAMDILYKTFYAR